MLLEFNFFRTLHFVPGSHIRKRRVVAEDLSSVVRLRLEEARVGSTGNVVPKVLARALEILLVGRICARVEPGLVVPGRCGPVSAAGVEGTTILQCSLIDQVVKIKLISVRRMAASEIENLSVQKLWRRKRKRPRIFYDCKNNSKLTIGGH